MHSAKPSTRTFTLSHREPPTERSHIIPKQCIDLIERLHITIASADHLLRLICVWIINKASVMMHSHRNVSESHSTLESSVSLRNWSPARSRHFDVNNVQQYVSVHIPTVLLLIFRTWCRSALLSELLLHKMNSKWIKTRTKFKWSGALGDETA